MLKSLEEQIAKAKAAQTAAIENSDQQRLLARKILEESDALVEKATRTLERLKELQRKIRIR